MARYSTARTCRNRACPTAWRLYAPLTRLARPHRGDLVVRGTAANEISAVFALGFPVSASFSPKRALPKYLSPHVASISKFRLATSAQRPASKEPHIRTTAGGAEQDHIIGLGIPSLHAGRPAWHVRNGKARRSRLLGKQPFHGDCWHMALDHVAGDLRRMTRGKIQRDAKPCLDRIEFRRVDRLNRETGGLKVPDPAIAASAIGVLMNRNDRLLCGPRNGDWQNCITGDQGERGAPKAIVPARVIASRSHYPPEAAASSHRRVPGTGSARPAAAPAVLRPDCLAP